MTDLTRNDLTVIEGGARISDRRIAEALGYPSVKPIRELIRRHKVEIESYGGILPQIEGKFQFSSLKRKTGAGRPEIAFLLNEDQALLLCMFARTAKAQDARRSIIAVFKAWRSGDAYGQAVEAQRPDIFARHAARAGHVADHLARLPAIGADILRLTHLPIWPRGTRPRWWPDLEMRAFLTETHRQMTLADAVGEARRRFGAERAPSLSGLNRYWMRLDRVFGPDRSLKA